MTVKLQIGLLILFGCFLIFLIRSIRKNHLSIGYSIPWILLDVILIILTLFPILLEKAAALFGIYSAMNMIFFLGFVFSLIIIYMLTVTISKMNHQIKELTQAVALLESDVSKQ